MKVYFSIAKGRPPGAFRKHGYAWTWAAWWKNDPREGPLPRPDAYGGARTREEIPELVRRHAVKWDPELEAVPSKLCQNWRRIWRDELPGNDPGAPDRNEAFPGFDETRQSTNNYNDERSGWFGVVFDLPRQGPPEWVAVLELSWPAFTEDDVRRSYRQRAFNTHPDRGGSQAEFISVTRARDQALEFLQRGSGQYASTPC